MTTPLSSSSTIADALNLAYPTKKEFRQHMKTLTFDETGNPVIFPKTHISSSTALVSTATKIDHLSPSLIDYVNRQESKWGVSEMLAFGAEKDWLNKEDYILFYELAKNSGVILKTKPRLTERELKSYLRDGYKMLAQTPMNK